MRRRHIAVVHTTRSLVCFALGCTLACGTARNGQSRRGGSLEASCPSLQEWKPAGEPETVATLERVRRYDGPIVLEHSGAYDLRAVVGLGDCFVTGADGRAAIELYGRGRVQLQPNTHACVLDAQPNTVFLVSGSLSGALEDIEPREAIRLVNNAGVLTLLDGAEARVALPRGDNKRRTQAELEMVRGQALLLRRTTLASDEPSFETLGIPCRVELASAEPTENALDDLLARLEAELESFRRDEKHAGTLRMYNLHVKAMAAAETSALGVLSECAVRGERETHCSALKTWRHEQLPRLGSVWLPSHLGRGVQTQLAE